MDYKKLKQVIFQRTCLFILVFGAYIVLNSWLNKTYVTVPNIFSSFPFWFGFLFLIINFLLLPLLVSLTIILSFDKIKDLKSVLEGKNSFSLVGIFGALLGGACPGCFVGLFPAFIGLFGISATLSSLPFYGFELQIISGLILIISLHYLTRQVVCLVKK